MIPRPGWILILMMLALSTAVTNASAGDSVRVDGFPNAIGSEWRYAVTRGSDSGSHDVTVRIVDTTTLDLVGKVASIWVHDASNRRFAPSWDTLFFVLPEEEHKGEIQVFETRSSNTPLWTFTPPTVPVLLKPQSFAWSFRQDNFEICRGFNVHVRGNTYEDCYIVKSRDANLEVFRPDDPYASDCGTMNGSASYYFVPFVGVVSASITSPIFPDRPAWSCQLVSYDIPGLRSSIFSQ